MIQSPCTSWKMNCAWACCGWLSFLFWVCPTPFWSPDTSWSEFFYTLFPHKEIHSLHCTSFPWCAKQMEGRDWPLGNSAMNSGHQQNMNCRSCRTMRQWCAPLIILKSIRYLSPGGHATHVTKSRTPSPSLKCHNHRNFTIVGTAIRWFFKNPRTFPIIKNHRIAIPTIFKIPIILDGSEDRNSTAACSHHMKLTMTCHTISPVAYC